MGIIKDTFDRARIYRDKIMRELDIGNRFETLEEASSKGIEALESLSESNKVDILKLIENTKDLKIDMSIKHEPLPRTISCLTQYSSSNPDKAPIIAGSQHFLLQLSTGAGGYCSQIALSYGNDKIAIRFISGINATPSSWRVI